MLYTAAVMACLVGEPHSYDTCQVVNANFKYPSEDICWLAVNNWLKQMYPSMQELNYEIIDAKCVEWLEMPDPKEKEL